MPKVRLILLALSLFLLIKLYVLIPSYLGPEGLRDRRPPGRFIRVESAEQFDAVLKEEQAALFVSCQVSVDSARSQQIVETWVKVSRPGFAVYFVMPEHQPFVMDWLETVDRQDLAYRGTGYGMAASCAK